MEKAFSRWPRQGRPNPISGTADTVAGHRDTAPTRHRPFWRDLWPVSRYAICVFLVLLSLGVAAPWLIERGLVAGILAIATVSAFIGLLAHAASLRRSLQESKVCYEAVFERAGISMWREDWSAAAKAVSELRERGVTDMEGHFALRPEELRTLCSKVIIKDVNAFTVEESGAPGKEAFIGPLDKLLPHTDQTFVQWLVAFAEGQRFFRSEAHITMPDGSVRDTLFAASLPADLNHFSDIIVTSLDITGYKNEQAKLLAADAAIARTSRISTVGALSASIAHEVNSPLAAVLANAQAALRWLRRPAPNVAEALEAVAAIVAEATRAKDVVARTRAFVGHAPSSVVAFDVVAAAREAVLLVEADLRRLGAGVHLQSEPGLSPAKGDVIQIQQVFTNLLLNAAQAMDGQAAAKEITISFRSERDSIHVDVADSGPGIPPNQLERIFDPFFTTKAGGMGIGLAICRNCIDAQGGNIWASSPGPTTGAVINFTLPTHDE